MQQSPKDTMTLRHSVNYVDCPCAMHCARNEISIAEKSRQFQKTDDTSMYL